MKKIRFLTAGAVALSLAVGSLSIGAFASDKVIYGTMNIPYNEFYKAELAESSNAYEVDAVSSATAKKWSMNGDGELVSGTYNQPNEGADGGKILGVTFPVAITEDALVQLGDNNYNFTETKETPVAYKNVTVENGKAEFSKVQDATPEKISGVKTEIATETGYGDYLIDLEGLPENMTPVYGIVVKTTDGKAYAMRHLENIWHGGSEIAFSVGITTTEKHGNQLSFENYKSIVGATINEIDYIMPDGYKTVDTNIYVPIKFEGSVSVESTGVDSGKTSFKTEGFPADYSKNYSVEGLDAQFTDKEISFSNAKPGKYTLVISDNSKKYADMTAEFVLSTDKTPAKYENNALVKADDATDEDFANFIANIEKVSVNGTEYAATGKRGVKIIGEDGKIDFDAKTRDANVFDGNGKYDFVVTATGYNNSIEFKVGDDAGSTNTNSTTDNSKSDSLVNSNSSNSSSNNNSNSNASSANTNNNANSGTTISTSNPATGSSASVAVAGVALAGLAVAVFKKKK